MAERIFLIGPMGAGKSAVGRRLAAELGRRFVDSDSEIESRTGVDIPYIFEKEGEAGFREREARVIDELTLLPEIVLATGGGVVVTPANRAALAERGTVVYLRASVEQQYTRVRQGSHRPLLQAADPRDVLAKLFAMRAPWYEELADVVVDTDGCRVPSVANQIVTALS